MLRRARDARTVFDELLTLQPLVPLAIAAITGVLLDAAWRPPGHYWLALALAASLVYAIVAWLQARQHWSPLPAVCALSIVWAACAAYWHHRRDAAFATDEIAGWMTEDWQPLIVRAVVARPPDYRRVTPRGDGSPWQSVFEAQCRSLRDQLAWRSCSGNVRVLVEGRMPPLLPGDLVEIRGKGQRIGPPTNPGAIDLQAQARRRGQLVRLAADRPEDVQPISSNHWYPGRWLAAISLRARDAVHTVVGEDHRGDLIAALVLGYRETVDRELRDQLVETGTIHMLAISGLHLGLVTAAVAVLAMILGFSRPWQLAITLGAAVLYAVFVGGQAPVVRAACLVAAVVLARWSGRPRSSANLLAAAGLIVLGIDPRQLLQTGTQLSFLAVAALTTMMPLAAPKRADPIQQRPLPQSLWWTYGSAWLAKLRSGLALSGWICLITTPLVWYHFHIVSPIAVVANVVLSLPLLVALLSGLSASLLGIVSTTLALPVGWIAARSIDVILFLVDLLAAIPGGHWWLPAPAAWQVVAFYGLLVGMLLARVHDTPIGRRAMAGVLLAGLVGMAIQIVVASRLPARSDAILATFIDVGHGTSVLVQMPDGRAWLYDAGGLADGPSCAQTIAGAVWHAGLYRLDGVVISHADNDHFSALPSLLDRFEVDCVCVPPGFFLHAGPAVAQLAESLWRAAVPVRALHTATVDPSIEFLSSAAANGPQFIVRHPDPFVANGHENAGSIVIELRFGVGSLILPGDLEPPGTADVLRQPPPPPGNGLMAAHHGSLEGKPRALLDWAAPSTVIISGGDRSARDEVLQTYGPREGGLWLTARDGAIRMAIQPSGPIQAAGWLSDPW
jgi:competence protein ComEC